MVTNTLLLILIICFIFIVILLDKIRKSLEIFNYNDAIFKDHLKKKHPTQEIVFKPEIKIPTPQLNIETKEIRTFLSRISELMSKNSRKRA